jgi:2-oxoglutarate ferredoxin oxidoreductase subunit gamma
MIRPGGLLIADRSEVSVDRSTDARYFELPLTETLLKELGSRRSANACMLGALVTLTNVVRPDSLRAAIRDRFRSSEEALRAFDLGTELVDKPVLLQG